MVIPVVDGGAVSRQRFMWEVLPRDTTCNLVASKIAASWQFLSELLKRVHSVLIINDFSQTVCPSGHYCRSGAFRALVQRELCAVFAVTQFFQRAQFYTSSTVLSVINPDERTTF